MIVQTRPLAAVAAALITAGVLVWLDSALALGPLGAAFGIV